MFFNPLRALLFVIVLMPSQVWGLALNDALQQALALNPEVQAMREQLHAQEAQKRASFADYLPDVTAYADYMLQHQDAAGRARTYHPLTGTLSVEQSLFEGGKTSAVYRQAESEEVSAFYAYNVTLQRVLMATVQAYMGMLTQQKVLQQQENLVHVLKQTLDATERRFKLGDGTRTDVAQAKARLSAARAGVVQAQASLVTARQSLSVLLGDDFVGEPLFWPLSLPVNLPKSLEDALADARQHHPSFLMAEADVETASYAIQEAKAGFWPTLTAQASLSQSENSSAGDYTNQQVGVSFSLPLYRGGATRAHVRRAVHTHGARQSQLELTRRSVDEEVHNAFTAHEAALAAQEAYQAAEEAALLAVEGVAKEKKLGTRSTLDLLNAQQESLDAQVALIESEATVFITAYRLLAATGRLTQVPLLEPTQSAHPFLAEKDTDVVAE